MKACDECKWYRQSFWYTPECTNNKTAKIEKNFITGEKIFIHRTCDYSRSDSILCGESATYWELRNNEY